MDLTGAVWRKARRSSGNGGDCVEVATVRGRTAVRDSKDRNGPVLAFTHTTWARFLTAAKRGRYDL